MTYERPETRRSRCAWDAALYAFVILSAILPALLLFAVWIEGGAR